MAGRRRFVAPGRESLDPACFDAPLFAGFKAHDDWFRSGQWPSIDTLNAALGDVLHPRSGMPLHFVEQSPALLADGLHYEQRIHDRGLIATRARSWHDLFNAVIWIRHPGIKSALNMRQCQDIATVGTGERTRAQCALTHFDEAGAIVVLRDPALLEPWDSHDWHALFWRHRDAWSDGRAEVIVFGHALLEHALQPNPLHTAKCLAVVTASAANEAIHADAASRQSGVSPTTSVCFDATGGVTSCIADAIDRSAVLNDPQDLRPLPLSGIPCWHPGSAMEGFYRSAECFRPARPGRRYPAPVPLQD